jgi:methanogenic corrinoid protein MtbC1
VNEITVGEEHFTTSTTEYVLGALFALKSPEKSNGRTVVVSGVMGETHCIPSRIVAAFFDLAGWRVIELGSDVPPMDLALSAVHFDADVLALSATITTHTRAVERTVRSLRDVDPGCRMKVLVGGQAFMTERGEAVAKELGADGFALDPREAVKVAGRWFGL